MSVIKWQESFNTGIGQFDEEHKRIVVHINTLFELVKDRTTDKDATVQICNELLTYTQYHFNNEEEAMRNTGYPGLEKHVEAHRDLKSRVGELQNAIDVDLVKGTSELYRFLRKWLIEHIQGVDQQYGPFLRKNEPKE